MITRRNALVSTAAFSACLGGFVRPAFAQSEVTVGTWGGDYGELLRQNIDEPILKPAGVDVLQTVANADPRKTKLLAERQSRRGSMDVACLSDTDMDLIAQQDVFEAIEGKVPRLSAVIPSLKKGYAVPHIYSYRVILYNPDKVAVPPKSYADLWDPKWRGRVGFSDILYTANIESASLAATGKATDLEAAKRKLLELKSLDAKVFPSNEALAAALKSEEVWPTVMWLARGFMWQKAGIPLRHVVPAEGATTIVFEAGVPRNARNKDQAWRYLGAMLQPEAQVAFADKMGYAPTVVDAKLPDELQSRLSVSEADRGRLLVPDYAYLRNAQPQMLDFWNKQFKA